MDDKDVEKLLRSTEREVAELCDKLIAQLKELEEILLRLMQ